MPFDLEALIVEPREHPALPAVLRNVCEELGGDTPLTIVHGQSNGAFARSAIPDVCSRVSLYEVNAPNLSAETYSALLTSAALWDSLEAKHVLVFQTDSGICEGRSKLPLAAALASDYCGAPWGWDEERRGGNGGFSVRDRETMRRLCPERPTTEMEDIFFTRSCSADPACTLCPAPVAAEFANESTDDDHSWAFHNNWAYRGDRTLADCPFNERIRLACSQNVPYPGDPPDPKSWVPALTPVALHGADL